MLSGWLAMWNPILGQKVRWQPAKPQWRRLLVPEESAVVLRAKVGGKDARKAYRCASRSTTVVSADDSYDE